MMEENDVTPSPGKPLKNRRGSATKARRKSATAEILTEEEIRRARSILQIPFHGSGSDDIIEEIVAIGGSDKATMLKLLDAEGDGQVSLHEWLIYLKNKKIQKGEKLFKFFLDFLESELQKKSKVSTSSAFLTLILILILTRMQGISALFSSIPAFSNQGIHPPRVTGEQQKPTRDSTQKSNGDLIWAARGDVFAVEIDINAWKWWRRRAQRGWSGCRDWN